MSQKIEPVALSVDDVCRLACIGRNLFYDEVKRGHLKTRKIGSRTIVLRRDLDAYLESLPLAANS